MVLSPRASFNPIDTVICTKRAARQANELELHIASGSGRPSLLAPYEGLR